MISRACDVPLDEHPDVTGEGHALCGGLGLQRLQEALLNPHVEGGRLLLELVADREPLGEVELGKVGGLHELFGLLVRDGKGPFALHGG